MKTEKTNLENSYLGSADGRDVYVYRKSLNNPLSIIVLSDEPFDIGEAWDTLMEVYPDAGFKRIDFIEFDKAVANAYSSKYAAVFHEHDKAKWKFLWEVELTDSSNYNPDRCFNGGSYFYVKTSMFFTRLNKSKEEFCRLDLWETSADFPYTSHGQFVREIVPVQIVDTNIEDLRYWLEQSDYDPIEWDDPVELASFAEPCNLKEAFFAVNCQIDSKGVKEKTLSFDEKIKRCDILDNIRKKYN